MAERERKTIRVRVAMSENYRGKLVIYVDCWVIRGPFGLEYEPIPNTVRDAADDDDDDTDSTSTN